MRPIPNLKDGVNLTPKHLQAIGTVAVRWAELEDTLSTIIWDIAKLRRPCGYAVTTHLSERTRADICNALADTEFGTNPLAQELRTKTIHILNNIYPKRNAVVHSTWGHGGNGKAEIFPIKARGKLKFGPREKFTAKDILAIAEDIYQANCELYDIKLKIQGLMDGKRKP